MHNKTHILLILYYNEGTPKYYITTYYIHTLQLNVTLSPGLTVTFDICVESIKGNPHVLTETNKNNEKNTIISFPD